MKTKHYKRSIALAVLLLIGSSLTHATPAMPDDTATTIWQWLFPESPQVETQVGCPDWPACPRPLAPEQEPEANTEK